MCNIPLTDIEQFMMSGWMNTTALDLSRLTDPGTTVTLILSDAPFVVPDPLPGGVNVIASAQKTFADQALVKVRATIRSDIEP